jgi:DNA-binding transcriptional regulator LsrR (DeoR family)
MVAKLYYLEQLPQDEVARIVRLSQSKVSRLLSLARKRGVVRIAVEDSCLRNRELETQLKERFGLRQAIVVTSVEGPPAEVVTGHGCAQASDLAQTLSAYTTVGVSGSRTLSHFVRALHRRPAARPAKIVPLMGHVGPQVSAIDAVDLCRILARKLGGESFVISAPAYAADAASRHLFMSHVDIQAVWKLFAQMQVALVGIGVIDNSVFLDRGLLQPWDIQAIRAEGAVGEIAGRFFDREGRECSTDFRDRVISIEFDALRTATIRGGLVKSLVIDEEGALAMLGQQPGGDTSQPATSLDETPDGGASRPRAGRDKGPSNSAKRSAPADVRRIKNRTRRRTGKK